jgi:hypothetical protein
MLRAFRAYDRCISRMTKLTKKSFPKNVYGLARVSTERQADEYMSLSGQFRAIDEYARSLGVTPLIYDEEGSGGLPWEDREILKQVLREAKMDNAAILVTAVDRLARELTVFHELVRLGIPVWVVGRDKITRKELWDELKIAKAEHDRIGRVAKQDHVGRKVSGKKIGGSFTYETSIRGGIEGYLRAGDRDRRMFERLREHPEWTDMSHKALADHLNAIGIRNVVTIAGRENDWTRNGFQRLRIRHQQELAFEAEMDIADGITPLDLDGGHSRVHAAKMTLTDDNRGGGALQ